MTGTPVGSVGSVTLRVRGAGSPGEVIVPVDGIPETWIAYADEPLDPGRPVLVVAVREGRAVEVVPWDWQHLAAPGWADPSSSGFNDNDIQR